MTATDELRMMLDERGVKWESYDEFDLTTQWETHEGAFVYWARERDSKLLVESTAPTKCSLPATPAQAITATLGEERTCTLEINTRMTAVVCSKCNFPMPSGVNLLGVRYCPHCGAKVVNA